MATPSGTPCAIMEVPPIVGRDEITARRFVVVSAPGNVCRALHLLTKPHARTVRHTAGRTVVVNHNLVIRETAVGIFHRVSVLINDDSVGENLRVVRVHVLVDNPVRRIVNLAQNGILWRAVDAMAAIV